MKAGTSPGGSTPGSRSGLSSIKGSPRYSVESVTSEQGLSKLQDDWNRLSATAERPNVFMTFDWFRTWNQHFTQQSGGSRRPHVLVLKRDGVVRGISPLIQRSSSRFGLVGRKLEFVGLEADYNDFVLGSDREGQVSAIVNFLAETQEQWDVVEMRDLRETGDVLAAIEEALSRARLIYKVVPEVERCPFLSIDRPWAAMVERFSKDERHRFRNQQKQLDGLRSEGLRIRIIEDPQNEALLLDKMIALESQKRVEGKLSVPFVGKYPEVFQTLFDTLGPCGWIYVALMEWGDRPIAWLMGFRCGKLMWDFLGAYDHNYARLSPGTMLVPALLDYGYSHGCNEYDFLRGEEPHKARWSTGVHQSYWLRIWSRTWTSRAHAFYHLDLKPALTRFRSDSAVG